MRAVPRLTEYYEMAALYYFERGQDLQTWFTLMAAWFYEDEDEKEWRGYKGQQICLDLAESAAV